MTSNRIRCAHLKLAMQKHKLIHLSELQNGKPHRLQHNNKDMLLCRAENDVYAVAELCTHEDISLSLGVLCEYRLRCPLHGSEFDIRSGKVLDEPADEDLATYPVTVEEGWVYLHEGD